MTVYSGLLELFEYVIVTGWLALLYNNAIVVPLRVTVKLLLIVLFDTNASYNLVARAVALYVVPLSPPEFVYEALTDTSIPSNGTCTRKYSYTVLTVLSVPSARIQLNLVFSSGLAGVIILL